MFSRLCFDEHWQLKGKHTSEFSIHFLQIDGKEFRWVIKCGILPSQLGTMCCLGLGWSKPWIRRYVGDSVTSFCSDLLCKLQKEMIKDGREWGSFFRISELETEAGCVATLIGADASMVSNLSDEANTIGFAQGEFADSSHSGICLHLAPRMLCFTKQSLK